MKRLAALCAALLGTALFLTACMPRGSGAPDEPSQTSRAEGTRSVLPFTVGRLYDLSWADHYSSWSGCSDGKAFYSLEQLSMTEDPSGALEKTWLILRIDYDTRTQAPLCSLPGCAHESTDCPAFLCGTAGNDRFNLTVVEGQLYVLHIFQDRSSEEYGLTAYPTSVWLDRAAMDGSGRERLAELPAGWGIDEGFPVTDGAALYGQYVDLSDSSVHGIRVALDTGEITSFSFGLDDREELMGAWGGQFILRRSDEAILQSAYPTVGTPERMMGIFPDSFGSYNAGTLVLYDPNAGTRTDLKDMLTQAGLSNVPYYAFIQQGKFYYITTDDFLLPQYVWQLDLTNGTVRVLAEFSAPSLSGWSSLKALQLFPAGTDTLEPYLMNVCWGGRERVFLLDVRDGSTQEVGLRYENAYEDLCMYPVAQTESGLWLVPAGYEESEGHEHYSFALAEPETVITGEGELYPIHQMYPLSGAPG